MMYVTLLPLIWVGFTSHSNPGPHIGKAGFR